MFKWIYRKLGLHTVASVTAEFNALVEDLKAVETRAWNKIADAEEAIARHMSFKKMHEDEQQAAARIAAKVKELVS